MAKDKGEVPEATETTEPKPGEPSMLVRKGRYVGINGRAFDSVPFGERLVCRTGESYEVREAFKYLWADGAFSSMWEWDGEPYLAEARNPGQVAAK